MRALLSSVAATLALILSGCGGDENNGGSPPVIVTPGPTPTPTPTGTPTPTPPTTSVSQRNVAGFSNPWAMTFLPDGRMLVTERQGALWLVTTGGTKVAVAGVPPVAFASQIGLHDIVLDPNHAGNGRVWLSYAEAAPGGGQRIAVASATLGIGGIPALQNLSVVWRSTPATTGGHLAARLAFSPDGRFLFVSTGDRQQGGPAQDLSTTLGKIVRLNLDGTAAAGNPFVSTPNARPEIFSLGHRNPLGIAFAADGRLFSSEMGPQGGDEFNLIAAGNNYGWPLVSEGNNSDGSPIPRHSTNSAFTAPRIFWTPTIAPAGIIQYRGTRFVGWTNDFLVAGLVQQGLVRLRLNANSVQEISRLSLGARIREVEQAPDGRIWVLQDGTNANLVELTPN